MISDYLEAALTRARYEIRPDGMYYGEIPGFPGVWSQAGSLEGCSDDLREALEDWLALALRRGRNLPVLDGIDPNAKSQS